MRMIVGFLASLVVYLVGVVVICFTDKDPINNFEMTSCRVKMVIWSIVCTAGNGIWFILYF